MTKIGVIGAGAWGTSLAHVLANEGKEVTLWSRSSHVAATIEAMQENDIYLPGVRLNETLKVTESLTKAANADVILLATPAQYVRKTLEALKADLGSGRPVVICAKGIELETGLLMTQVAQEAVPNVTVAVMTGPTFAREIATGTPSAVTLATDNKEEARNLSEMIGTRFLRPYISDDPVGAQIGGAVKNVIAIACGAVMGLGESARAALVTRGLTEMGRLAYAMGANKETLMGMCGIGDLLLTCTSQQSRNYSFGYEIGQGKTPQEILESRSGKAVTEGFYTAGALRTLARKNAVDMPISESVHLCLNEGVPVSEALEKMLDRPVGKENI